MITDPFVRWSYDCGPRSDAVVYRDEAPCRSKARWPSSMSDIL